jgi:hypothetical protein
MQPQTPGIFRCITQIGAHTPIPFGGGIVERQAFELLEQDG